MQIVTKLPTKGLHRIIRDGAVSPDAEKRLKWMDYVASHSLAQASRHFDIPESTLRFWKKRFNRWIPRSLECRSHKPKVPRNPQITLRVLEVIVSLRKRYGYNKVKLQVKLRNLGISVGQSRIQLTVNWAGLRNKHHVKRILMRRNRKHMYTVPNTVYINPGGLVYLDVKHVTLQGCNGMAYQFTAIDHATRYLVAEAYPRITSRTTVAFLDYVQKQEPLQKIEYVGSDNGSEFLGDFEKALKEKQIPHVFSSPRSPKQNPFVERVIRTTIEEYYQRYGVAPTVEALNQGLEKYTREYNTERPHHGIGLRTPQQQYHMLQSINNSTANPQLHPN